MAKDEEKHTSKITCSRSYNIDRYTDQKVFDIGGRGRPVIRFASKIIVISEHNERTSIIIDSTTGLPADTPTTYLILNYLGYRSYNTIESKAKNIAQLWNWLNKTGINLPERMLKGDVLSMEEVASLSKWLSINRSNAKVKNIRVTGGTHQIKTDDCISIINWLE